MSRPAKQATGDRQNSSVRGFKCPPSALRAPSPARGRRNASDRSAAVEPLSRLRERGWDEGRLLA
ncbi:hypothetical protein DYQ94_05970 [Xanthomonas sp. LMG 8993]|nr:hypothetical protein [Xanthomonas sp. LMG 8993]QWM98856.1 hypothetical protein DGN21_05550 [Xanthomonas sp. MLO165]